jgi:hypothetical protein
MALLLRDVRQNRWYKEEAAPFLAADDVPADPVGDLRTQQNLLSVFEVAPDRSNIERIVCALAVGKQEIKDAGYILVDSDLLTDAGIEVRETPGGTADKGVNAWHRDLVLSGNKLISLTKAVLIHGESGTVLRLRLTTLLEQGIRDGYIPEKFRSKLAR